MGLIFLGVLVFFTLASGSAAADTPKSGTITSDETWTQAMSPIWVEGDVTIANDATVTINPGVDVLFNGFYTITVSNGSMVADGDAAGAGVITFSSNFTDPGPGAWEGIVFNDDDGTSILDDVIVEYARTGVTLNGVSVPVSNTRISDSLWYGVYVSGAAIPTYDLIFSGCNVTNAGSYGMYFESLSDVNLTLQVTGCSFSNYGTSAIIFGSLQWANFDITVDGSSFNASTRAVDFSGTSQADATEGNTFRFVFSNNWLNSSLDSFGVYMPADVRDFQDATLVFSDNHFLGHGSRAYGIRMNNFRGLSDYWHNLTLQVTGNEFIDLWESGVYVFQIWNLRNVDLTFSNNVFQNTDAIVMDYGVYVYWAPWYGVDTEDSRLSIAVDGNTAADLDDAVVYFAAGGTDGFRAVSLSVRDNDFRNTRGSPYLDYGVFFQDFAFNDPSIPSSFRAIVSGTTAVDLDNYAVDFSYFISGFRDVFLDLVNNRFENVDGAWMETGVYFWGAPTYTLSYPGSITLNVTNSEYLNLTSYAVYLSSVTTFSTVAFDVDGNDFSGSYAGLYLPFGVDNAEALSFVFRDNLADGLGWYPFYASDFGGLSADPSQATFVVSGNTVSDGDYGLYLGIVTYYDSQVTIQSNTITGPLGRAIHVERFSDQRAQVDILSNTIRGADEGIWIRNPAFSSGDTTLTIRDNSIQDVGTYGIYIDEVWRAMAFILIQDNAIVAAPDAIFTASLIHFDEGSMGPYDWEQAFVDAEISGNVLDGGLHGIYIHGTDGLGATVLLDISDITATGTNFGITFQAPVGHAADIMNVRIRDSTFRDNSRGFLSLNNPGYGLLPINITGTQVLNFGDLGGYAISMGSNFGANVKLDVWASTFEEAPGSLGDVYAGSGAVTMNFYYTGGITTGEANDPRQLIRVLWKVDVEVLKGRNLNVPAVGVVVIAYDQFGTLSFTDVTDANGMITDQYVSGIIIAHDGSSSYAGPAIQTFRADWGPFNGTTAATFASNGTVTIYLPGDADGDGLNDMIDTDDDNDGIPDLRDGDPYTAGFLDFTTAPYFLHLWVLLGLIGVLVVFVFLRWVRGGLPPRGGGVSPEWQPPGEEPGPP